MMKSGYLLDVFWPKLPIPIHPLQYLGNHGNSDEFKLDARNNDWIMKKSQYIHQNLSDFPNITLGGLEWADVAKRHLIFIEFIAFYSVFHF